MVKNKKKISLHIYLLLIANILPIMAVFGDVWSIGQVAYFYWGECALLAILALAMYAKYLIVFFLLLITVGTIIWLANPLILSNMKSIMVFWSLYSLCWLAYIETGKGKYGKLVKKLKPTEHLIIYCIFMGIAIGLCLALTSLTSNGWGLGNDYSLRFYMTFISVAMLVPTLSISLLKVIDMIGQKHFLEFLLGTYHRPVEQSRIVLFLDMVGSSAMAEKLDPKQSMRLIAQFIYDSGYIFRIHNGDILNYTGDGLVVMWSPHQSNNALSAVYKLRNHFSSKSVRDSYWKSFGIVPDFRIGIHAGQIVLNQIGEEKLFIGLYGDVVNTAARLEQMNKELGTNILLSSEVTQGLNQSWKALLKPLGEKEVRGRDQKVNVFTLYKEV